MPLIIALEDEFGNQEDSFDDRTNLVALIERSSISNQECPRLLDFIDWYGNTVFNRIQMRQLQSELEILRSFAEDKDEQQVIATMLSYVERCQEAVHTYIKIYGD
jgi:hypothetical protein